MTTFVLTCAAMIAAALLWLVLPLLRRAPASEAVDAPRSHAHWSAVAVALIVPALAAVMYAGLSDWDFSEVERQAATAVETDRLLAQLEAKLAENPQDIGGWLLLGRSYAQLGRFPEAVTAYQHAYDVSKGENVEATLGLAESLVLTDASTLTGRARELLEAALGKAPNHPKALWYGSMAALQSGDLKTGRDRLQLLLAQNPPQELRSVLERQIQDLNQQLGEAGEGAASSSAAAPGPGRAVRVAVAIDPKIQSQLAREFPLFVLARDPAGGPPLAVQRHSTASAPLTIELSERDAMTPARTIASAARVQIVARVSRSGTPQAQSGDFYGEAEYDFSADQGVVNVVIDRVVP